MGGAPLDWAKEGSRFRVQGCGGGFAEIDDEVAAVLAIRYLSYDVSRRSG